MPLLTTLPPTRVCRALRALALLLALPIAEPALAAPAEPPHGRLSLGFRLAAGKPLGNAWKGVEQTQITDAMLRLQADLEYRLRPWAAAGAYLAIGYGSVGDGAGDVCVSELARCSVESLDAGFQGELRFGQELLDPWLGASLGIEGMVQRIALGDSSEALKLFGPTLALSGGVDLDIDGFAIGPFVSGQLGWYTYIKLQEQGESYYRESEVDDVAAHVLLWLGVRGSFGLGS